MQLRYAIIIIILLCTGNINTYGQDPYYINISTNAGLPSNTIYHISQDSKGFIWVAHAEGLSRYDGHEFKTYTCDEQTSKPGTNIVEDKHGRIWYQNFDGYLYYVENDSLYPLHAQRSSIGFTPYGILDSEIVAIGEKSFDFYDINTLELKKSIYDSTISYLNSVCGNNTYYVTLGTTLFTITSSSNITKTEMSDGYPVMATQGRVFTMDKSDFTGWIHELIDNKNKPTFNVSQARYIQAAMFADEYYWFCSTAGVWAFKPDGTPINGEKPFFGGKNMSAVFKDNEGNYWFGTLNEGLLFVPDLNMRLTEMRDCAPSHILTDDGNIYLSTNKNEIYTFDHDKNTLTLKYRDSLSHDVLSFNIDPYDKSFMLVAQSLKVLNKSFKPTFSYSRAIKETITIDDKYYAYSGTSIAGLIQKHDKGRNKWDSLFYSAHNDMYGKVAHIFTSYRFSSVAYSPFASAIYFAGNNGLYKVTPDNTVAREVSSDNEQIYATQLKLFDHRIFALTARNTLLVIDSNDHVTVVKNSKGLQLYRMCPVGNELIVMTDRGIKKYNTNSNSLVASEILRGIKSEEIRDIKPLGDMLIVATNRGIITTPAKENLTSITPVFNITSITINNREYKLDKHYSLEHDENNIEIKYSILCYSNPDAHSLYYKINNGKWTHTSKASGGLKLASLSPGSYKIAFYVGELTGTASIVPTDTILLSIEPPFWNTAWFLIMVILLVASLAYTYYKWQTGLLKKQNQLLTDKVELERNLHKSVLTSIRSQMNPHFFYNALNTIQSFIITDDKRNASTYLSKFSKLTRTILEMTEKETITLAEEINALKLYLDLEKVRFNNEFQYSINTESGLDPEMTRIPSMIVQPYIENSIKHGLLHKSGEKTLLVDFLKNNENLSIIIDDNGIGRKKSMELNRIRTDKHKSFATEATMKRIEILNKDNKNIGVVYTDKTDEFGRPAGTIVTITIPLIKE